MSRITFWRLQNLFRANRRDSSYWNLEYLGFRLLLLSKVGCRFQARWEDQPCVLLGGETSSGGWIGVYSSMQPLLLSGCFRPSPHREIYPVVPSVMVLWVRMLWSDTSLKICTELDVKSSMFSHRVWPVTAKAKSINAKNPYILKWGAGWSCRGTATKLVLQ